MKNYFTLILLFLCYHLYAQNLVPNGDFEQYYGCPTNTSQLDTCINWHSPSTNNPGVSGTPDYYNQCSLTGSGVSIPENIVGFQYTHSGPAYKGIALGIGSDYREYIEANLSQPLIAGNCYHLEMYVNLANYCRLSTHDIQVYFSDLDITGINNWLPLPFIPQVSNQAGNYFDTLTWTLVSGNYIAQGGETNIIIGNFKDDSLTDSIVVNWGAVVSADIYVYIDDVSLTLLTVISENEKGKECLVIFPNPVKEKCKIKTGDAINKIIIKNTAGEIVFSIIGNRRKEIEIDFRNLPDGIYFLEAELRNEKVFKKLIKL